MNGVLKGAALAGALLVAMSCAAPGPKTTMPPPGARKADIAALDEKIKVEKDPALLSRALFDRGHAYLEEAEAIRGQKASDGKPIEGTAYGTMFLGAIRDFEDVANNFPQSADAPEALFHLGVVYDYPNISSFGAAINYYKRVVEQYPGTESAKKAQAALDNIAAMMHQTQQGQHGVK